MHNGYFVRKTTRVLPLALGFVVSTAGTAALGESVTLTSSADTELREASPLAAFGTGTTMVSGGLGSNAGNTRRRALLRFELADAIPPGATVTSVELTIHAVQMLPLTPMNSNFELHRILRPWRETTATWTFADNPVAPWGEGGASRDDDAVPAASASVPVSGLGQYRFASTPELVADVQAWLDDPESNAGWLLRSDTEAPFTARHFGTREHSSSPPRLTVDYELAPTLEPVTISGVTVEAGEISLAFEAQAGVGYRVEFRDQLAGGDWVTATNVPPPAASGVVSVTHAIQGAAGYYRVESTVPNP